MNHPEQIIYFLIPSVGTPCIVQLENRKAFSTDSVYNRDLFASELHFWNDRPSERTVELIRGVRKDNVQRSSFLLVLPLETTPYPMSNTLLIVGPISSPLIMAAVAYGVGSLDRNARHC